MTLTATYQALLAAIVQEQGLTVQEAAQRAGLPFVHFVSLLHGRTTIDLQTADRILRNLGTGASVSRAPPRLPSARIEANVG